MSDVIVTSQSAYGTAMKCMRMRWHGYEQPSAWDAAGNVTGRGWEPQRLNLPLSTGGWCHWITQGVLLGFGTGLDMSAWRKKTGEKWPRSISDTSQVILAAKNGYLAEVQAKGLELGLSLDGAVAEEMFLERTIAEQVALIEAFGWAYHRVRLPRMLDEYEIIAVEQEETTPLSGDVVLQSRCDAVLRRKVDRRLFIYNLKTTSRAHDKQWQDQWLVDQQLMTETLAVERRLGERVYGVIIDAFDKGPRVNCWWDSLKELRDGSKAPYEGAPKWQRQRSRLLYGYKCEETIPGRPTLYDFEGTTRKGWGVFAVWTEQFAAPGLSSPVAYWVNWLPEEQVQSQFVTLEPIMRNDDDTAAKVRQMVSVERQIWRNRDSLVSFGEQLSHLDELFPQHDGWNCGSGARRCSMYRLCWEGGASDPASAGYKPREANHPSLEEE